MSLPRSYGKSGREASRPLPHDTYGRKFEVQIFIRPPSLTEKDIRKIFLFLNRLLGRIPGPANTVACAMKRTLSCDNQQATTQPDSCFVACDCIDEIVYSTARPSVSSLESKHKRRRQSLAIVGRNVSMGFDCKYLLPFGTYYKNVVVQIHKFI